MATGSLRRPGPPPRTPQLIPTPLHWGNYSRAFALVDIVRYSINSLVLAAFVVPLTLLFASWAGFGMSRLAPRSTGALVGLSLGALMVPASALLVPRFAMYRWIGNQVGWSVIDTYIPLIAPSLLGTSPFFVLVYYWSFRRVPEELYEAARLEGLGPLGTWWRMALPLVRPVTAAVALLTFVFSWSNFVDPLIYLSNEDRFTLPLGLRSLAQLDATNYPVLLAGSLAATLPVVLALLVSQRYFLGRASIGWIGPSWRG